MKLRGKQAPTPEAELSDEDEMCCSSDSDPEWDGSDRKTKKTGTAHPLFNPRKKPRRSGPMIGQKIGHSPDEKVVEASNREKQPTVLLEKLNKSKYVGAECVKATTKEINHGHK